MHLPKLVIGSGVILLILGGAVASLFYAFSPKTGTLTSVDCGAFSIELKEWVSPDPLTGTHIRRYFWYNEDGFSGNDRKIDDGYGSAFPLVYAPDNFQWFETTTEQAEKPVYAPYNIVLYKATEGLPALAYRKADAGGDPGIMPMGFYSDKEYEDVRDCVAKNRDTLETPLSSWYQDRATGDGYSLPVRISSISHVPVTLSSEGNSWGPQSVTFTCPQGETLHLAGDTSVRVQPGGMPIGHLNEKGVFTEEVLDTRPERYALAQRVLGSLEQCRTSTGRSMRDFFSEWRTRHAQQFIP